MKLLNIAFDLDGVLVDIMPAVNRLLKERHNVKMLPIKQWNIKTEPEQLPEDLIWECIHSAYDRMDDIRIYSGAKELLWKLFELTDHQDPVKIITARPPKRAANLTYKVVSERLCDFPYELVIVSDNDKLPYLNRYKYMVEDRRRTAKYLAWEGKHVYLVNRTYNKMEKTERVSRIRGVYDLIPIAEKFVYEVW